MVLYNPIHLIITSITTGSTNSQNKFHICPSFLHHTLVAPSVDLDMHKPHSKPCLKTCNPPSAGYRTSALIHPSGLNHPEMKIKCKNDKVFQFYFLDLFSLYILFSQFKPLMFSRDFDFNFVSLLVNCTNMHLESVELLILIDIPSNQRVH